MLSTTLTDSSTVHYWTYHGSSKPTLVMIHGFTGSHEGFQYIVPDLAEYHLVIPDVPGFGESTIGREDWSIAAIARLLNDFVRSLNLARPPHLLGHSMGGLVVAAMIAQDPELYAKQVILIAPVPTAVRRTEIRALGAQLGTLQYLLGDRLPHIGPRIVRHKGLTNLATRVLLTTKDKDLQRTIHGHHYKNLDYISSIEFYRTLHREITHSGAMDYADSLCHKSTLLIVGEHDNAAPYKEQTKLATAINAENVVVIANVGHLAHYEKPTEISAAIRDFLK